MKGPEDDLGLSGKVAIVSGGGAAGDGIGNGRAAAILLARSGTKVVVADLDKKLAELNGNSAQFRLSEDTAFLEAMNQAFASGLFYGNPGTDPKQFLGFECASEFYRVALQAR